MASFWSLGPASSLGKMDFLEKLESSASCMQNILKEENKIVQLIEYKDDNKMIELGVQHA